MLGRVYGSVVMGVSQQMVGLVHAHLFPILGVYYCHLGVQSELHHTTKQNTFPGVYDNVELDFDTILLY